jgi:type I restriction enzyme M protein
MQEMLDSQLKHACDLFRGKLYERDYKEYILDFFLLKYICDNCSNVQGNEAELQINRFEVPDEFQFYFLEKFMEDSNFGKKINESIHGIELHNEFLNGVFFKPNFVRPIFKSDKSILINLYLTFKEINLIDNGNYEIAYSFSNLLKHFSQIEGKRGGELSTPYEVAELMARLIKPQKFDSIYDGACGTSMLLLQIAKGIPDGNPNDLFIYGQDLIHEAIIISKMNLLYNRLDSNIGNIIQGDTFSAPAFTVSENKLKRFDIVVSHPPFSFNSLNSLDFKNDPFNRFHRGVPPRSKGDYAFISHLIESGKDGKSIIGIIVSHGVLFRRAAEYQIRKNLLIENLFEAIIGLPNNIFYGTSIGGVILIFNKGKSDDKDILFIDASKDFEAGKMLNVLRSKDINRIEETYQDFKKSSRVDRKKLNQKWKKFARVVKFEEIKENDYNLNISKYIDTYDDESPIDLNNLKMEIQEMEIELSDVQEKIKFLLNKIESILYD